MGANHYIFGKQFGDKQLDIAVSLLNGGKMISLFDLKTRKRHQSLRHTNSTERLAHREILRLLSKGVIKIKSCKCTKEFLTYEYELTNNFKKIMVK